MAMRFGRRICSQARINNLSGVPTSLRGRSYSSKSLSRVLEGSTGSSTFGSKALAIAVVAPTIGLWGAMFHSFDAFHLKRNAAERKAKKKVSELLERLDREKFESDDACLEMVEREVNALKETLSKREPNLLDLEIYSREMAALVESYEACTGEKSTPQTVCTQVERFKFRLKFT